MYVMNREKVRQIEIERLKQEALEREKDRNSSLLDKSKKGLVNLSNRIKLLINK